MEALHTQVIDLWGLVNQLRSKLDLLTDTHAWLTSPDHSIQAKSIPEPKVYISEKRNSVDSRPDDLLAMLDLFVCHPATFTSTVTLLFYLLTGLAQELVAVLYKQGSDLSYHYTCFVAELGSTFSPTSSNIYINFQLLLQQFQQSVHRYAALCFDLGTPLLYPPPMLDKPVPPH